jgi:signal transduction histidine kinase
MENLLRPALEARVTLDIVASPTRCWVRADRNQTELAILNLALNARDAMPDGGTLSVVAGVAHLSGVPAGLLGDFGTVAVQDTGTGMTPEVQARVFEPFFTTKGPNKGTGLGLSRVYGFAEQTHGAVAIDSARAPHSFSSTRRRARHFGTVRDTEWRNDARTVAGGWLA